MNAAELMHNHNGKVITLNGDVKMIFDGNYFSSDFAEVDFNKGVITAIGSVRLQNIDAYIEAEKIVYNYNKETVSIERGYLQSGNTLFQGDYIERINANTYVAENAHYSTCTNCPETWHITGKKIKATIGGYADISVPVLRVYNLPVLALPRLIIPLKNERQSGLLVPSFEKSETNKFSYAQPFYWAISPDQDSTTTLKFYQTRGIKLLQEYRFMLNKKSRGQLNTGYFWDREFSNSGKNNDITSKENRAFVRYSHYFQTKHDIINRMEVNYITDLRYLRDFPEDTIEPGFSSLENNFSLTKNFDNHHISAAVNFNQNLVKADPFAKDDNAIHKYPEIKYSLLQHQIKNTGLLFNLNFDYVNFFRFGKFFDDVCTSTNPCNDGQSITTDVPRKIDTEGDKVFDPAVDIIRAGQRFDFQPTLTYPFQLFKVLDFEASLAMRETFYAFNLDRESKALIDSTTSRSYLEPKISAKTQFSRVYGNSQNIDSKLYKHIITPEIQYSILDMIQEPDHTFFGDFTELDFDLTNQPIVDDDLWGDNSIQFDYEDRVSEKRLVTFNLTNRIIQKDWINNEPFYKEVFYLKLSQSYDFFRNRDDDPKPWTRLLATTKIRLDNLQLTSISDYNPYENKLNNLANLRVTSRTGEFLQFSHQYLLKESDGFRHSTRTEFASVDAGFRSRYIDFSGGLEYSLVKNDVRAWRYKAILKPPGQCFKLIFSHWQPIGRNEIKYRIEPAFNFESSF